MIKGLDRLSRKLKRDIPRHVRKAVRAELEKRAKDIVATAKGFVPVDEGDLRDSIGYTFGGYKADNANVRGVTSGNEGRDADLSVTIHAGDKDAFYAAFVEFGTAPHNISRGGGTKRGKAQVAENGARIHPGSAPHPFFFPAYRLHKKRAKAGISRAMRKAIKDGAK